jgi:hypothetical protein
MSGKTQSPLIVTGMHRSGTSMLSRLLERLGIFMGKNKEGNYEAKLFLAINDWLLRQAGASWDNPRGIRELTEDPEMVATAGKHVARVLNSNQLIGYLGWPIFLRYRRLNRIDFPWAFKDPRSVLTLPVWLDLFPEARVVLIHRNGVDVANSLKVRSQAHYRRSREDDSPRLSLRYRLEPRPRIPGNLALSVRCLSLEGGYQLWKEYGEEADRVLASVPAERQLVLKFEDFVSDPVEQLPNLCRMAGIEYRPQFDDLVRSMMKRDTVGRYRHDEQLQAFYDRVADDPRMKRLGYGRS